MSNKRTFTTLAEVTTAVDQGLTVHWKSDGYTVVPCSANGYLVKFRSNGHCVGLTGDYKPSDLYTYVDDCDCDCAGCDNCGSHCVPNCESGEGEQCTATDEATVVGQRLEYFRTQIRAEGISLSEIVELQSMADVIDPSDLELLEWAGVPEAETETEAESALDQLRKAADNGGPYTANGCPEYSAVFNHEHRLIAVADTGAAQPIGIGIFDDSGNGPSIWVERENAIELARFILDQCGES